MTTQANFTKPADDPCYDPRMTRAQAMARRTAGTLRENCVVVITDGPTIGNGTTSPTEIELNPTSPTELGQTARVFTTFDNEAWAGLYNIDLGVSGSITKLTDNLGNTAQDLDANSPTVHTQFPWGNTQWRDNYVEDTSFTSAQIVAPASVQDSFFQGTTVDFTGWISGSIFQTRIISTGVGPRHISGTFVNWLQSEIISSTVDAAGATAEITMTRAHLEQATIRNNAGIASSAFTFSNARIIDSTIINDGDGRVTVTDSEIVGGVEVIFEAGANKAFVLSLASRLDGQFRIRFLGTGTTNSTVAIAQGSKFSGRGGGALTNSITVDGAGGGSFVTVTATFNNSFLSWNINGTSGSVQATDCIFNNCKLNRAATATGTFQVTEIIASNTFIEQLAVDASLNVRNLQAQNSQVRITATATDTGDLSVQNGCQLYSGLIEQQGARATFVDSTEIVGLQAVLSKIILNSLSQGTIPTGDQIQACEIRGAGELQIVDTTAAPAFAHAIQRTRIIGSVTGLPQWGRLRIEGNSEQVYIDLCNVEGGELRLNDVPAGALSAGTAMHDNYVGAESSLVYDGGDAVAKQIRNNRVEGGSVLNCTGLTGSAGAALGDVFSARVANQSTLDVSGARVPGFPNRNIIVENQGILTIDPGGSVLQFRVAQQANVTTGAFNHFDSEVSGAFVVVLTASNINTLKNKGYSDVI